MNKPVFKDRVANAALVVGSLLILCLVLEIILRIVNYNPFGEFFASEGPAIFIQPSKNPQRLFEAKPGAKGKGWGTQVSINQFGFRGREYARTKAKDSYRIVVIGDSVAFGNNLAEDKNYPALLERMFTDAGRPVEVLNLALGGYDTLQEVATLEDIGLQFAPDLVILGYCINDIGVASGNLNYIKRLKNYNSAIYRSRFVQFIRVQLDRVELIQYSKSANTNESFDSLYKNMQSDISGDAALQNKITLLSNLLNSLPEDNKGKYFFTRDYTQTSRIQRLRFALERLQALQKNNAFDVLVLVTPYLAEDKTSQPLYQAVYAIIEHEINRLDFASLNFYRQFADAGFDAVILKENDGVHPNELGHELIAKELYQSIRISK